MAHEEAKGPAVGVDVGGSATRVALLRGGEPAIAAVAGPANLRTYGADAAAETISAAIANALGGERPAAIVVGAAGAGDPALKNRLAEILRLRFGPKCLVRVTDDASLALYAAVDEPPAAVLLAGTGSIVLVHNGQDFIHAGGLGPLLGDEGSGYAIGLAAARLLGRTLDLRGPRDELTAAVAEQLGVATRNELIAATAGCAPAQIAALAKTVISFAGGGNRAAAKIVQAAAADLSELFKSAVHRFSQARTAWPWPIVFAGGLLRENSLLTYLLETRLAADHPDASIVRSTAEPAFGALRFALRNRDASGVS